MTTIHAGVTVREVPGTALDLVGGVAGRGMRDNPTHLALYGDDPAWREIVHGAVMQHALAALGWPVLGAYDEAGTLVGVAGRGAPGACRVDPDRQHLLLPVLQTIDEATFGRVGALLAAWGEHDASQRPGTSDRSRSSGTCRASASAQR